MYLVIVILLLIVFVTVVFLRWLYSHACVKGHIGEMLVSKKLNKLPDEYKVLNDVVLSTDRGTTQIDHIVVSRYGVFVIETKNYRGRIYGNDNAKEWKQVIKTNVRYSRKWYKLYSYITTNMFYNPVKQSLGHSVAVKNVLNDCYLPIVSIVVFSDNASLENVKTQYNVVNMRNVLSVILDYRLTYVSYNDVENITAKLQELNLRKVISNRKHVKNLDHAKQKRDDSLKRCVCPLCGSALVLRKGMYGKFVGCSNYPKCKYKCATNEMPLMARLKLSVKRNHRIF